MNSNLSQTDYTRFRELVRQKSGLQLANYRLPDLVRTIEALADKTGVSDPNTLYELLCQSDSTGRAALDQFIGALTVGESYFFRNRPQFDALEKKILPELIESQQHVKRLRIWCAGCSTGEEPYSLAILLKRLLPDIARWKILILATDINRSALQKARQGVYRGWSLRQVPSQIKTLYFNIQDTFNHQIRSDIRQMVTFSYLNLVKDIYPSILNNTYKLDLILCRNVLIYFDQNMLRKVVGRLHNTLVDGGWLVVGHAEPSPEIFHQFKAHYFPRAIIYQKARVGLAPPTPSPLPIMGEGLGVRATPVRPKPSLLAPLPIMLEGNQRPTPARPTAARRQGKGKSPIREALALWDAGQRITALKQLDLLKKEDAEEPTDVYRVAKLYANQQKLKKANSWLKILLKQAPLFAPAHYLQGLIYSEWGNLDQALSALRRAIFAEPQFVLAHFALATLFGRLKEPKRAEKSLNKVIQLLASYDPDAPISEGDKITAKGLQEMVSIQRSLLKNQ